MATLRESATSTITQGIQAIGDVTGGIRKERARARRRLITGLDVGTTKVCAIIAEVNGEGQVTVLGLGSNPSRGMRRGVVTDVNCTVEAIEKAFVTAYELAHVVPPEVFVGIAGDHIAGTNVDAMVEVANPNVGIDRRDCDGVIRKALNFTIPPDTEILYHVVREYIVNGNRDIRNPIGLFGTSLEARLHVVTGSITAGNNLARCVKKAGLRTSGIVLESVASAHAILTPAEKEMGVVVIDLGGGTCDIAIFAQGCLQFVAEIAQGGDIITHDIATVLRCSPHDAENLKKKFGHANPMTVDAQEQVDLPNPLSDTERIVCGRRELAEIIEARVEEILMEIRKVIQRSGFRDRIFSGVVLTGGTALVEGISEVAERMLDMPTRIGKPRGLRGLGEIASSPIYSTAVGLVHWAAARGPGFEQERWLKRKIKEVFDIYA